MRHLKTILRNLIQLHKQGYYNDFATYRKVIDHDPNLSDQDRAGIYQAFDTWLDARVNGPKLTLVPKH